MGKSLVIVSNRLPVSVKKVNGKLEFYPSVGGLATGLSSYAERRGTKWIGWPGLPCDDLSQSERKQIAKELSKHRCYPVYLNSKQLAEFYNGYSNSVLWPLFHELEIKTGNTPKNWKAYREVNQLFTQETLRLSKSGNTIWVHDYQLLLMPGLLRLERPKDNIGFFLHIPFPDVIAFENLPHARSLINGMLGAGLVGLHTAAYVRNFLAVCQNLHIGVAEAGKVALPDRVVRVTEFPMGIDYSKFAEATKQRAVRKAHRALRRKYRRRKVIATVDRLDPTKGLAERLEAYQQLLRDNPQLHGKVVMVMLAVPSRAEIQEYKTLKVRVERLVEQINNQYGSRRWQPVEYMYQTLPFEQLAALYQRADIAFIAPLRDGMNLVAKEYLASKPNHDGVLVLSETAGAAEELKEAIQVNPAEPQTLVDGLHKALTMPKADLRRRATTMQKHIEQFTVQDWAERFMNSLQQPIEAPLHRTRNLGKNQLKKLVADYNQAKKRLFLCDYDGVLREFTNAPGQATPSGHLLKLMERLSSDPMNEIVIVSGRQKTDLEKWFGNLPLALAAEHGALFRRAGGKNWHRTSSSGLKWQRMVVDLFEYYASLTPGAHVEQKDWSIVWHYRSASPYYAHKHLVAIRRLIKPLAKQFNLSTQEGHKILEVRPADINKGTIAQEWLIHDHDFILAIGDDATDEDMFAALPPTAYTIKVGRGQTVARFRMPDVSHVLRLLDKL